MNTFYKLQIITYLYFVLNSLFSQCQNVGISEQSATSVVPACSQIDVQLCNDHKKKKNTNDIKQMKGSVLSDNESDFLYLLQALLASEEDPQSTHEITSKESKSY